MGEIFGFGLTHYPPLMRTGDMLRPGHDARDFTDDATFPGAKEFQQLILGGIESAMGKTPFCQ